MSLIEVKEDKRPKGKCPHCHRIMYLDLTLFKDNITEIIQSNCPSCGGEIFTGILVLSHKNLPSLANSIQYIINSVNEEGRVVG